MKKFQEGHKTVIFKKNFFYQVKEVSMTDFITRI